MGHSRGEIIQTEEKRRKSQFTLAHHKYRKTSLESKTIDRKFLRSTVGY
jgi:hypothetical protein